MYEEYLIIDMHHSRATELREEAQRDRLLAHCHPVDGQWLRRLAWTGSLLIALGARLQRPALEAGLLSSPAPQA